MSERLAQTIAWCEQHARRDEPATSLRTIARCTLPADRADDLGTISWARAHACPDARLDAASWRSQGKLLVYFPDADTMCGGALSGSEGYFDGSAAPPWDTWVVVGRVPNADISYAAFVLAWVPTCFVELAERGIDCDPMEAVIWLDDADRAIKDAVAAQFRL